MRREDLEELSQLPEGVDEDTLGLISWGWEDELEWEAWMYRRRRERREIDDVGEFRKARKKRGK